MEFTYEQAANAARGYREETIREMGHLIYQLQRDLDRLKTAQEKTGEDDLPTRLNAGFYISQHCLRYEQTMKAGWQMEQMARLAGFIAHQTEKGN